MNVLFITPNISLGAGWGRTGKELPLRVAKKHTVTVLSENIPPEASSFPFSIALLETCSSPLAFVRNCLLTRRLAKTADVVHALDGWPWGVYAFCGVWGTPTRLVISGIGTYSVAPFYTFMKGMLLRMAYRRADNVPCISSYTETRLKEHVPEAKTTIIHHGCIPLTVPSKEEIHALQKKFSIPEDAFPLVISVGEVKERKGQYDTLQGIVRLKERFPRIVYCLAGRFEVAYRSSMEALAKDAGMEHAIRFLGPLTDDRELASLYSLADVHALNSNNDGVHQEHFEGFGLVVVEAGQFGVPSVGSKQTGIEDAISDGDSGILVAQKDHDGIKDAIVRLVEDREHFKKGAKRWAEQFSWDRTAEHILQLYES